MIYLGRSSLACVLLLGAVVSSRADQQSDPLRLVPNQADFIVKIEQPRRLLDSVMAIEAVQQLQQFQVVRELYDSTNYRRFQQLLAHFEKKVGCSRFELLDKVAGGGVVLAVKAGADPAPVLLVVQSNDADLLRKFVAASEEIIGQELVRQESKDRIERSKHRSIEVVKVGKDLRLALAGPALLMANNDQTLHAAIDLHLDGAAKSLVGSSNIAAAHKLLPPAPLAWSWLNLESIRKLQQVKDAIPTIEMNPVLAPFAGSWLDGAKRAPFLCTGLHKQGDSFLFTVRLPRGVDGMAAGPAFFVPDGKVNAPPLLQPKNVVFSTTYYLNLEQLWDKRATVLPKQALDGLDKVEKNSAVFLGGVKLSKLLSQAGRYQRFLQVQAMPSTVYKKVPKNKQGAFALVQEMRDPAFGKSMNTILRAAAFLASTQVDVKPVEEKRGNNLIVTYIFPENKPFKGDTEDVRFNFSPSYATVGNHFVVASTVELAREMVDLLEKESQTTSKVPASVHMRLFAPGFAAALRDTEDVLVTQAVLTYAITPEVARKELSSLIRLVAGLGAVDIDSVYGTDHHRFDIRWNLSK
jgi:hypothetical protein